MAPLVIRDIAYGATNAQRLDLYLDDPEQARDRPLVVFVRGGAWIADDKSAHAQFATRLAASTGCAVAVPNYTLSSKNPSGAESGDAEPVVHPAHARDVLAAFEFLRTWTGPSEQQERETGPLYDARTIFAIGHSCGAHILGSIFLSPPSPAQSSIPSSEPNATPQLGLEPSESLLRAVRGIVTTEGIFDIDLLLQSFPSYRQWFIERAFGPYPDYHDVSLTHFGARRSDSNSKPEIAWLLVHSTGDTLVDRAQASAMYDHLTQLSGTELVGKNWDTFDCEHDDVLHAPALADLIAQFVHTHST